MANGADPTYAAITDILESRGFRLVNVQTDDDPSQALYLKERPGAALPVTVPLDCTSIPDSTIRQIMQTAQVPEPEYRHLLRRP